MVSLSLEQFLERVKNKQSVSRFDFSLSFKWDLNAVKQLKKIIADLSSADLSSADLRFADLSSADLSFANLEKIISEAGFFFSVKCGLSFSQVTKDLKASQETKDYLLVQSLAFLAWDNRKEKGGDGVMEFMRRQFQGPEETTMVVKNV